MDQAGSLRSLMLLRRGGKKISAVTIGVTSGKGGVGKSNISIFMAKTLVSRGFKVLLIDADYGLANLHILMGIAPQKDLGAFYRGECTISDAVVKSVDGIDLIAGASGNVDLANLSSASLNRINRAISDFVDSYDYCIVDTGAGIASNSISTVLDCDLQLIVLTPDPTSLADAYAVLKICYSAEKEGVVVVANMANSEDEGEMVIGKLQLISEKYLGKTPLSAGVVPMTPLLAGCIREDRSVLSARGLSGFLNKINAMTQIVVQRGRELKEGKKFPSGGNNG